MPLLFIVNGTAGRGRARRVWQELTDSLQQRGTKYDVAFTHGPGDAGRIAQERGPGYRVVVVVGGDGTLNEVGNGLFTSVNSHHSPVAALGWIPAGTGNDLARTLRIPTRPLRALEVILSGAVRPMDVGVINGHAFFNVAGVGFHTRVAQELATARIRPAGRLLSLWVTLRLLNPVDTPEMDIRVDDIHIVQKTLLVAVGNGRYYGGGMMLCPAAVEDDGYFDVCIAGNFSRREALQALQATHTGRHLDLPKFQYHTAKSVTIDGARDLPVHADGEIIGSLPARFEMVRHGMPFIL